MENDQYLRNLYYGINSPTAYTSEINLWRQIKHDKKDKEITREVLKKWLEEQYTYSLHKPYKKPALYKKTITSGVDDQWQADLVEMREFSDSNDGCNYLLCVIDCFSKYAWVEPLKTKTGVETTKAFESIFNKGRILAKLQVDNGKEFYNKNVEFVLKNNNIEYLSTFSDKKAAMSSASVGH